MDDNIDPADQSQAFLQRAQSQSTSISPSLALESGRQRTFLFFLKTSHTLLSPNICTYCTYMWLFQYSYLDLFAGIRVGHRVLFRLLRSVLFRSLKRMFCSFPFFFRIFGDLWDPKECSVLFRSFPFFSKERKRTQRTQRSFAKNVKERK